MSESKKSEFNYHPIQLRNIKVLKLLIIDNPDFDKDSSQEDFSDFSFYHMHSDYDTETKGFAVRVRAVLGKDRDCKTDDEPECSQSPFDLEVELVGIFEVDDNHFDVKNVDSFAKNNAPLVIYPYLREHVYSLTNRAGYESALLPLFEVPPFRLAGPER